MPEKIKVGIWGLGRAGAEMQLPEMLEHPELFEFVAGCDIDEERRQEMLARLAAGGDGDEECPQAGRKPSVCKLYTDPQEFLKDEEVELVSIATRSPEHVDHALQALTAGKYVFLEKPIAMDSAQAQKLAGAGKQYPGKLFFRHNRRFEPAFVHIREIIATGILGDICKIKLHRHNYQRRADWQTIIRCGGGQLNNWGPHIIDHALQLLDYEVKEIWSDLKKVVAVGDAEDDLKIVMKGESGLIVDLEISGGVALPQPEYVIHGSKGSLICRGEEIKLKYIDPGQELPEKKADSGNPPLGSGIAKGYAGQEEIKWIEEETKVAPKAACGLSYIWKPLYESIRMNKSFPIKMEEAIAVVELTETVRRGSSFYCII